MYLIFKSRSIYLAYHHKPYSKMKKKDITRKKRLDITKNLNHPTTTQYFPLSLYSDIGKPFIRQ